MKNRLVNKKVVSSIGISIMAFVTATLPVLTVLAEERIEPTSETNTPDSADQDQAEQVTSEQSQAIESAQGTVTDAKVENPVNDTLKEINTALDEANKALGNIKEDVAVLDNANRDVDIANKELADVYDDSEGYIENAVEIVEDATEQVNTAVGALDESNVGEIVIDAENAEEAAKKEYDSKADAEKRRVR